MNQVREYWYIGSILANSEMQKKRMEEWTATGLYPFLTSSISNSVAAAISCFLEISSESTLDEDKTLMAVSSSKMLPWKIIVFVIWYELQFYLSTSYNSPDITMFLCIICPHYCTSCFILPFFFFKSFQFFFLMQDEFEISRWILLTNIEFLIWTEKTLMWRVQIPSWEVLI